MIGVSINIFESGRVGTRIKARGIRAGAFCAAITIIPAAIINSKRTGTFFPAGRRSIKLFYISYERHLPMRNAIFAPHSRARFPPFNSRHVPLGNAAVFVSTAFCSRFIFVRPSNRQRTSAEICTEISPITTDSCCRGMKIRRAKKPEGA